MYQRNPNNLVRIRVRVTGRVQGVGFRAFVQNTAAKSGLTGWVRNLGYDQVEAVAEGPREKLEKFAEELKIGPAGGRVEEANIDWEAGTGEFSGFIVRSSR